MLYNRPVDAARESARDQFEEEQAAQRRAHLLIFSAPSVIILAHRRRTAFLVVNDGDGFRG